MHPMPLWKRLALVLFVVLVIAGHVLLWASPDYPFDVKLRLTLLNAVGWAVVILPAFGVAAWVRATERRNRER